MLVFFTIIYFVSVNVLYSFGHEKHYIDFFIQPDSCFITIIWDHSFSMHAKFSVKQDFLPPDTHTYKCVSGDKKY